MGARAAGLVAWVRERVAGVARARGIFRLDGLGWAICARCGLTSPEAQAALERRPSEPTERSPPRVVSALPDGRYSATVAEAPG